MRTEVQEPALGSVPLAQIELGRRNPRRNLRQLDELAASLQAHGLLQPIVLRKIADDRYEIVAGHRRVAAARELGWTDIPAVLRTADDDEAFLLAVVENLQRSDLSSREEAAALEVLVRERGWSTRQVAEAVKRSASYVSRRLRVFEDPILAPLVLQGKLSVSAAEQLLPLPISWRQQVADEAAENGWDLRRIRRVLVEAEEPETKRRHSMQRRAREFRTFIRTYNSRDLSDADRRELRLLFRELHVLAQGPTAGAKVVPPLEVGRRKRA